MDAAGKENTANLGRICQTVEGGEGEISQMVPDGEQEGMAYTARARIWMELTTWLGSIMICSDFFPAYSRTSRVFLENS